MSLARYPSLIDKVVFITGGGSGIGAAMVEAFAEQKANVAFVDIAVEASKDLVAKIGASHPPPLFLQCDLTDIAALETAMEEVQASAWGRSPCSSTTPPTTSVRRRTK